MTNRIARRDLLVLAGGLTFVAARQADAHHGWGSYEAAAPVQTMGRVEQLTVENPHALLILATADKTWEVVLAPPSRMTSRGLEAAMMPVGKEVEVMGYPSRNRPIEMRAEWVKVDAKTVQLR